jgi:hypothetical protein
MPARSLSKARAPLGRSMFSALTLFSAAAGVIAVTGEGGATIPPVRREYGAAQSLGNGQIRSYVLREDGKGAPVEIGVAFTGPPWTISPPRSRVRIRTPRIRMRPMPA